MLSDNSGFSKQVNLLSLQHHVPLHLIPSPFVQNVVESMRSAEYEIDSTHTFTDLRGGQEDTGDEQVLVVWTAAEKNLEEIALRLGEVSEGLPYE